MIDPGTAILASAGMGVASSLTQKQAKPDYTGMQNSIRWKVADAKAAGIHPLAALGSPTTSPVIQAGDNRTSNALNSVAGTALKYQQAKKDDETSILQKTESVARTKLLDAQTADFVLRTKLASDAAIAASNSNSSQDGWIPVKKGSENTQGLMLDSDLQNWEDKYGEAANIMVVPKIGYERLGKNYPKKWLNQQLDNQHKRRFPKYKKDWRKSSPSYQKRFGGY